MHPAARRDHVFVIEITNGCALRHHVPALARRFLPTLRLVAQATGRSFRLPDQQTGASQVHEVVAFLFGVAVAVLVILLAELETGAACDQVAPAQPQPAPEG